MTTHTDRETQLLSEMEELSDEIERLKAKRAELITVITQLTKLGNDLRDSCSHFGYVSAEYEYKRAEGRISAWDKFCAEKGLTKS